MEKIRKYLLPLPDPQGFSIIIFHVIGEKRGRCEMLRVMYLHQVIPLLGDRIHDKTMDIRVVNLDTNLFIKL